MHYRDLIALIFIDFHQITVSVHPSVSQFVGVSAVGLKQRKLTEISKNQRKLMKIISIKGNWVNRVHGWPTWPCFFLILYTRFIIFKDQ